MFLPVVHGKNFLNKQSLSFWNTAWTCHHGCCDFRSRRFLIKMSPWQDFNRSYCNAFYLHLDFLGAFLFCFCLFLFYFISQVARWYTVQFSLCVPLWYGNIKDNWRVDRFVPQRARWGVDVRCVAVTRHAIPWKVRRVSRSQNHVTSVLWPPTIHSG